MQAGQADGWVMRITTAAVPQKHREALWREVIGRVGLRLEIEAASTGEFHLDSTAYRPPNLIVARHSGENFRTTRTRSLLNDGNDDVRLLVMREGQTLCSDRNGQRRLNPGEVGLHWEAEWNCHLSAGRVMGDTISLKHKLLAPLVSNLDDVITRPLATSSDALRMLGCYIGGIIDRPTLPDVTTQSLYTSHIYDLVALALGARGDAAAAAQDGGVRAARLAALKADIVQNLGNGEISADFLAGRHAISVSYVRRLFERDGTSLTEFVVRSRLVQAHRLLTSPHMQHLSIAAIAYRVGFGDLSYFNRTFRRRHGATPSEVRAMALG